MYTSLFFYSRSSPLHDRPHLQNLTSNLCCHVSRSLILNSSFHFIFRYPYITPIYPLSNPYIIPIVSIFFSIIPVKLWVPLRSLKCGCRGPGVRRGAKRRSLAEVTPHTPSTIEVKLNQPSNLQTPETRRIKPTTSHTVIFHTVLCRPTRQILQQLRAAPRDCHDYPFVACDFCHPPRPL